MSIDHDDVKFDWICDDATEESHYLESIEVEEEPHFSYKEGGKIWLGYTNQLKRECYKWTTEDELDELIKCIARILYFGETDEGSASYLKDHRL